IHVLPASRTGQIHEIEVEHVMSGVPEEIEKVVMLEAVAAFGVAVVVFHRGVQDSHDSTKRLATKVTTRPVAATKSGDYSPPKLGSLGGDALGQRGLGRSVQRRTVPINRSASRASIRSRCAVL